MLNEDDYPFFNQTGLYERKITTSSEKAQVWFNRALLQGFGFNHEETVRCCDEAIKCDPLCSMAYFLKAHALGVNYNNIPVELEKAQAEAQYNNWLKASETMTKIQITETEKDFITAQQYRVGDGTILNHRKFDIDYSSNMRKLYQKYPEDLDVICFFVESMMNLNPWNLWVQKENLERNIKYGDMVEGTSEIVEVLEIGLSKEGGDRHPGLRHFYIHALEMSPQPQKALCENFDISLKELLDDSGHLIHMPTHIHILCGRYYDSIMDNLRAVEADEKFCNYLESTGSLSSTNNFYTLYRCHNVHFIMFSAILCGNYHYAIHATHLLVEMLPIRVLDCSDFFKPNCAMWLEGFVGSGFHTLVKFGKWDIILSDEPLGKQLPVSTMFKYKEIYKSTIAMLHYSRGIAYTVLAGSGSKEEKKIMLEKANKEYQSFENAFSLIEPDRMLFNNSISDLLSIAKELLEGEILYRTAHFTKSFEKLRKAVDLDSSLPYDEPWGWMSPSRHVLGALLLEQGEIQQNKELIEEAIQVYKTDLGENNTVAVSHPNNVWSLRGLEKSLRLLGKSVEAKKIGTQLECALKHTDIPILASCMCNKDCF